MNTQAIEIALFAGDEAMIRFVTINLVALDTIVVTDGKMYSICKLGRRNRFATFRRVSNNGEEDHDGL